MEKAEYRGLKNRFSKHITFVKYSTLQAVQLNYTASLCRSPSVNVGLKMERGEILRRFFWRVSHIPDGGWDISVLTSHTINTPALTWGPWTKPEDFWELYGVQVRGEMKRKHQKKKINSYLCDYVGPADLERQRTVRCENTGSRANWDMHLEWLTAAQVTDTLWKPRLLPSSYISNLLGQLDLSTWKTALVWPRVLSG